MIGYDNILAKFFVKDIGSTLSTFPPVNSANLLNVSRLHSSPIIETIFIVKPFSLAY
jgi:hypothetical protein